MNRTIRRVLLVCCLAAACAALGCGRTVKVKGQLTKGGKPFTTKDRALVQMIFHPDGGEAVDTYPATVNADGTFEVVGKEGKGIPPGKYRISVEAPDPYPDGPDLLRGKFAPDKTPIVREVGAEELVIDLDQP
jgi:hypothetical protein